MYQVAKRISNGNVEGWSILCNGVIIHTEERTEIVQVDEEIFLFKNIMTGGKRYHKLMGVHGPSIISIDEYCMINDLNYNSYKIEEGIYIHILLEDNINVHCVFLNEMRFETMLSTIQYMDEHDYNTAKLVNTL